MKFDAEATLRSWALDVRIGDAVYEIPALPASEWLLVVATGSPLDIVPGMLTTPDALDDQLADGFLADECVAAARAAIADASGTTWWTATYLTRAIADTWVGGEFTLRGVDPTRLSFAAYLAAAYRLVTREMDDNKRAQLDMEISTPPAGLDPEEWFDPDEAAANFEAAMANNQY